MPPSTQALFDAHLARTTAHDAAYLGFCIWNVAHHMIYVYSRVPLSRGRLIFNAFFDLLGNGWRHLVLVAYLPLFGFDEWVSPLCWLNLFHAVTHLFGVSWATFHPQTMLPYVADFQARRMPKWQLGVNWLIEQNDMAFYAATAFMVGAVLNPVVAMVVVMLLAPVWLPKRAPEPAE